MNSIPGYAAELVITAPEPYGAELAYKTRARLTLGVLTQLVAQAKQSLVIASPFIQSGKGLDFGPLADAMQGALKRGILVDIVSTGGGLKALPMEEFQATNGRIRLFRPLPNMEDERRLGSHAKFCITDRQHAYVGSANLTGPGLTSRCREIESGLSPW